MKHNQLPYGGLLQSMHLPPCMASCDPESDVDNAPTVSFYAESTPASREHFPYDWALSLGIALTGDDDPPPNTGDPMDVFDAVAGQQLLTRGEKQAELARKVRMLCMQCPTEQRRGGTRLMHAASAHTQW